MSNEILTSAGGLGPERRSFDRLYVTAREPIEIASDIHSTMGRLISVVDRRQRITRAVFRTVTDLSTIQELSESGLVPEAAIPLDHYDRPNSYLAIYGYNSGSRAQTIVPIHEMVEQTRNEEIPALYEPNFAEILAVNNLRLTSTVWPSYETELFDQWGDTFVWTPEQVVNFCRRIYGQTTEKNDQKNVWFTALGPMRPYGIPVPILSSAMGERLDIQGFNKIINLVESTEWRTRQLINGQPKGLIVPVLNGLNQQVLFDLPNALIIAECNYASRSDRRGHQVGFVIPPRSRELGNQILPQNVGVHDGKGDWPLRDFVVVHLSRYAINNWYQGGRQA